MHNDSLLQLSNHYTLEIISKSRLPNSTDPPLALCCSQTHSQTCHGFPPKVALLHYHFGQRYLHEIGSAENGIQISVII
ncbi:hypothetical protein E2C01_021977 [Portunus trituberculatus]|uniref:Uncharacterized protein n=1 Tax=Portunus trituberculatus TaxID=210409 RepID=A0A5B7E6D0_PORTR|nr:hypothetical protein [Portunus trituberculatus]